MRLTLVPTRRFPHALRALAHHRRPLHDRQNLGAAPRAHGHPARPGTGTCLHALCARALLRAFVPLLLVQPLPLPRGAGAYPFRGPARGDAPSEGEGLRLRERLYRRGHPHGGHRRAVRDHRLRPRSVLHQGDQLRDEPEPPDSLVSGETQGPHPAFVGGRAVLRQRASAPDGPLREVRQRRGDLRAHRRGGPVLRVAQRGHDLQLPFPDRGHPHQRLREDRHLRLPSDHLLAAVPVPRHHAQDGERARTHGLRQGASLLPYPRRDLE